MPTIAEERATALKEANDIVAAAKAAARDLADEESTKVKELLDRVDSLDEQARKKNDSDALMKRLGSGVAMPEQDINRDGERAKSFEEHILKSDFAQKLKSFSPGDRLTANTPEYKAATDPLLTTGITVPPQFGGVIQTNYRRLTIADLLSSGTISGNAFTYWTQGALTGDVTTVAEGALKPSLNFAFGQVTEVLTKLAGVTKISDEMMQDLDFLVSVVRSQLGQRLGLVEEDNLLNGNGTAPNLRGLLNRVGIQTYSTSATYTPKKGMDAIFHAMTLISTVSFLQADGIVINPADYETIRLGVDGQQQYYGGGPFTGAYGNSGLQQQPGLWGLPTVVTPAIAAGTVLVGAFQQGAQVFRKGGVRLEATNSNEDDFKKNLVALRIEERVALACYYPTAFVKITLTP